VADSVAGAGIDGKTVHNAIKVVVTGAADRSEAQW
jgi:hypothetical protein